MITQQELKDLLEYNPATGVFTWLVTKANCIKVGDIAGYSIHGGYREIRINGMRYKEHRLAWKYMHGEFTFGETSLINHVDGNRSNNKASNLKICSRFENERNSGSHTNTTLDVLVNKTLTQKELKSVLEYNPDTGLFTWLKKSSRYSKMRVGDTAGGLDLEGYTIIRLDCVPYKAHRLAWLYVHGEFPTDVIDHIDRNPSNNRISNLRDVSSQINSRNTKKHSTNTSGVTGVRSRSMVVNGKTYKYQVVSWRDVAGVKQQKCFNEETYGIDEAKALAVSLREDMLLELNRQGSGYTESHGK